MTFTAQVNSTVVLQPPTGTVTFMDGSASLGTATLDAYGIAKFTTTSLAGGTHTITANYAGDAIFRSTSANISQMVSDFSVQSTISAVSIKVGQSGSALIALTPQGGFNQSISFSCSGLPSGANCSFSPATLTPSGTDIATDTMTISTTGSAAAHRADNRRMNGLTGSAFGFASLLLVVPVFSRKKRARLVLLAGLLFMFGAWGCGGSSSTKPTPTPPNPMVGTYSVTVTATPAAGTAHTATLSLTITQ